MNKATEKKEIDFEWISSSVSITAKAISKANTLMIDLLLLRMMNVTN